MIVLVGSFLTNPRWHRWLPVALGGAVTAIIALLGPFWFGEKPREREPPSRDPAKRPTRAASEDR
jgi:hypothetical protein